MRTAKKENYKSLNFFPDQVIHHILIDLIKPMLMRRLDPYAVASIPGRGQGMGVKKIEYWVQKEPHCRALTKYCGKGDIRHCFESVKPDVVMKMWEDMIKDKKWLGLMSKVMYSCSSLPLGNYCSAWILNILLKDFDEAIRRCKDVTHYLRYMDDFVFFCRKKRSARKVQSVIEHELHKLGLELKGNYQVFNVEDRGIDLMGYRIFRNNTILRKRNQYKIYKLVNKMKNKHLYKVKECQSLLSRLGQATHCNSKYIFKDVGQNVDLYKAKKIIADDSRRTLYGGTVRLQNFCGKYFDLTTAIKNSIMEEDIEKIFKYKTNMILL